MKGLITYADFADGTAVDLGQSSLLTGSYSTKKAIFAAVLLVTVVLILLALKGTVSAPKPNVRVGVGDAAQTEDGGIFYYSTDDGQTWIKINSIFTETATSAVWNGNIWVASGSGTNILAYSYNGIDWTGIPSVQTNQSSISTAISSVVWTGTYFAGVQQDTSIKSFDGISWIGYSGTMNNSVVDKLATNGNIIVATPLYPLSISFLSTSDDGISYSVISSPAAPTPTGETSIRYWDINWDGIKFTATYSDDSDEVDAYVGFLYSFDGLNWTKIKPTLK